MAKGDRKRSNKDVVKAVVKKPLRSITPQEAQMFQALINISNQYGKLKQQYEEYNTIVESLKDRRKKVATGAISMPVMLPLGKNKFYAENDKKVILEEIDGEIRILSNALKGVKGQLNNTHDAYVEAGLAIYDLTGSKFTPFKPKNVYAKGCSPKKEEKVLFEGELDEILKDEEKKEELKKAIVTAKKENEKLEKKEE